MYLSGSDINISKKEKEIVDSLNSIVSNAKIKGDILVSQTGWFSRSATREWVNNIVNMAENTVSQLKKMKNGKPLFLRNPKASIRILNQSKKHIEDEFDDLKKAGKETLIIISYKEGLDRLIQMVIDKIAKIAESLIDAGLSAGIKNPKVSIAIGIASIFGVAYLVRSFK